jgi:phosphatidylserine decarboxylase
MTIHREGWPIILIAAIIAILLSIGILNIHINLFIRLLLMLPVLVLFILIIWFFRVPERKCIPDETAVYAPADGKVVVIEKTVESEYFKDERIQISIFMSPLNVHQNVYPISGTVSYTKYHKGDYLVAWHPKSSLLNERSTIVIDNGKGTEILVRQIAGAVARRICTYAKVGDKAEQGAELGFIKFGSRVDIFLPLSAKVECSPGQVTHGKTTLLARMNK